MPKIRFLPLADPDEYLRKKAYKRGVRPLKRQANISLGKDNEMVLVIIPAAR